MLEARNYVQIMQVMPFLAAICDRLCGEGATTTKLFVQYLDMVYAMTRVQESNTSFSCADLDTLEDCIRKFRHSALSLYGDKDVQKSEMAFPKFHALAHVVTDIREAGSLAHYMANAYEAAHKAVKNAYQAGSRRGDAGHVEALAIMARADLHRVACGKTERGARLDVVVRLTQPGRRARGARTSTKVEAMTHDTVAFTAGGKPVHASDIEHFLHLHRWNGALADKSSISRTLLELSQDLGGDAEFVGSCAS